MEVRTCRQGTKEVDFQSSIHQADCFKQALDPTSRFWDDLLIKDSIQRDAQMKKIMVHSCSNSGVALLGTRVVL